MTKRIGILWLVALIAACDGAGDNKALQEFVDATPDVEGFLGEVTGDADTEGLGTASSSLDAEELAVGTQSLDAPTYLAHVRAGIKDINATVRPVLVRIADLVQQDPITAEKGVHVWETTRNDVSYRFTVKKYAERRFGWLLQGKKDGDYAKLMAGAITLGVRAHRGRGIIGFDADAMSQLEPAVKARGKLLVGFAHGAAGGRALSYALKDFVADAANRPNDVVSARVQAFRGPLGATLVRIVTYANLNDLSQDATKTARELVIARVRWLPGIGGRADGIAFGGDVPEGSYYKAAACWNAQQQQGHKSLELCVRGGACSLVEGEASVAPGACGTHPELKTPTPPSEDLNGGEPMAGDVVEDGAPVPPLELPSGEGSES